MLYPANEMVGTWYPSDEALQAGWRWLSGVLLVRRNLPARLRAMPRSIAGARDKNGQPRRDLGNDHNRYEARYAVMSINYRDVSLAFYNIDSSYILSEVPSRVRNGYLRLLANSSSSLRIIAPVFAVTKIKSKFGEQPTTRYGSSCPNSNPPAAALDITILATRRITGLEYYSTLPKYRVGGMNVLLKRKVNIR
jgi:hypothetical protein